MIERRTYAQPLYPGSLYPEEGANVRIENYMFVELIMARFKDKEGWFAIEVVEQNWQLWKTEEGEEEWRPANDGTRKGYRIYVGELLTSADVEALEGDHKILLSNMAGNGWDPIVRTRRGNFQPFEENDVVVSPEAVMAS